MITLIEGLENNTVGARYEGDVTGEDYVNVLWPAVAEAAGTGEPVNIVAVMTDELHHMSFAAMLSDGQLGLRYRRDWGRIAFVSDHKHLDSLIEEKSKPFHLDVRVFTLAEEQAAIDWAVTGEQ
jgi:hypothetical protein